MARILRRSGELTCWRENEIAGGLDSGELQAYATWFIILNIEDILDVG